jgi:hypothetical protein
VPTLLLHRTEDPLIDVRHSRYMAERIPGAKLVELPGVDHLISMGDTGALVGEIREFVTGERGHDPDRALLTVLFTDICDGTSRAAEVGDRRWRDLLRPTTPRCAASSAASAAARSRRRATGSSRSSTARRARPCRCARRWSADRRRWASRAGGPAHRRVRADR